MGLAEEAWWSTETADAIHSGFNIEGRDRGAMAGAVVVTYPKDRLDAASHAIVRTTIRAAALVWAAASAMDWLSCCSTCCSLPSNGRSPA